MAVAERRLPGRAGRLWLRQRLAVTRRSAELLDRKLQLLERECVVLRDRCEETARQWALACAAADRWSARTAVLGAGDVAVAAAGVTGRGRAAVRWADTMGVRRPVEATTDLPPVDPVALAAANGAVAPAWAACRTAVQAAVEHAVADRALHLLEDERQATQHRLRAIEHRRLPALVDELHDLEIRLDELEREEMLMSRWASRHSGRPGVGGR